MITFIREKNKITVQIDTGHGFLVNFSRESSSELDAILLANCIRNKFDTRIERIKSEAYGRGYTDKTKRKPKAGWHSSNIDKIDI